MAWPAPLPPPPPPPPPPMRQAPSSAPEGLGWALVPVITAGFGAPASFLYAAVRRRSVALGGAAALYGIGVFGTWTGILLGDAATVQGGLVLFILTWTISTVHALAVRSRIYPALNPRERMNQRVVEMAQHRRTLREAARKIVAEDPGLARELRIGRPDLLPRAFDDGGLVDVNHVPPDVLSRLPGLTYEMVVRIMRIRTEQGGFVSAEELVVHADLPPSLVAEIAEYALFIR